MERNFKVGATLESIRTLKAGDFKIAFETQELQADQGAAILGMRQKFGWLIFVPEDATEIEIPTEAPKEFKTDKTPAQRLRGVLYVLWQQTGPCEDFEDFYRKKMNRLIDHFKGKLDES